MSILYFYIFFLQLPRFKGLLQSWLNGGKRSHYLKRRENWEFHSESFSIMADLVKLDYEGKSVGLTQMNLSKTTIARCFRVHEDGLHLKIVKNGKCENVWPRWNGKFLLQREQKIHMWLPFLLKIKIYKRIMMMIFREHLVLGTYARSFVLANYFFLQCFISVLCKEGNVSKARFDHLR